MKTLYLLFAIFWCVFPVSTSAQLSAIEIYGGVGAFSVPDEFFSEEVVGLQFVGSGENFFLQQQGTRISVATTEYEPGQSIQFGIEGHYSIGAHGSVYAGLRIKAVLMRYKAGTGTSEVITSGPVDTVFFEPGGIDGGSPFIFCPDNSFNFNTDRPDEAFTFDVGVPIGYRHRILKDRIGLRVQGSVNIPIFNRHTTQTILLQEDAEMNCLRLAEESVNASSAYDLNTFVFRLGGGLDFSLGHSFNLGVLVQQQLNSTVISNGTFVMEEGRFVGVTEIRNFKPLFFSLVGRYTIR